MIKKLHINLVVLTMISLMFSCATTNDVASNNRIQKRKYRKGFFIDTDKKMGGKSNQTNIAINTEDIDTEELNKLEQVEEVTVENEAITVEEIGFTIEEEIVAENEIEESASPNVVAEKTTNLESTSTNKNSLKKQLKKSTKSILHSDGLFKKQGNKVSSESGLMLLLLVLLAIFISPVAVAIYDGIGTRFWLDLIFWLVGVGVGIAIFGGGLAYLFALVAIIYALLIIFDVI